MGIREDFEMAHKNNEAIFEYQRKCNSLYSGALFRKQRREYLARKRALEKVEAILSECHAGHWESNDPLWVNIQEQWRGMFNTTYVQGMRVALQVDAWGSGGDYSGNNDGLCLYLDWLTGLWVTGQEEFSTQGVYIAIIPVSKADKQLFPYLRGMKKIALRKSECNGMDWLSEATAREIVAEWNLDEEGF